MSPKIPRFIKIILATVFSLTFLLSTASFHKAYAFKFLAWGDTKSGLTALKDESNLAKPLNSLFTLYSGDLTDSSSQVSTLDTWKTNINGGTNNGMFDITFAVRGNHDSNTTVWPAYFDFRSMATRVGVSNYTELNTDVTYSFDYGNSHFVGIDILGDVSKMSAAQIAWLDSDLTAAENRGLTHAFLFWHGPVYSLDGHCCTIAGSALIQVINKHPIISATFHGHEHVVAYAHMNSSRLPGLTHEFEQFVSGDAGAGVDTCSSGRYDYCMSNELRKHGFVTVDVSGSGFTVNTYALGSSSPVKTMTFTKGVTPPTPTPTATPSPTPTGSPGPTPTRTPTPTPSLAPIPSPTPTPPTTNFQPTAPYHATFYYPWYKNPTTDGQWSYWTDHGNNPPDTWFSHFLPDPNPLEFNPETELYSSNDYINFKWQLATMAQAKIEVAIASWWGQGTKEDLAFSNILNNFMPHSDNPYPNLRWTIYYEDEGFGDPSVATIVDNLNHINSNFAHSPYYLKINGKPVIFVYAGSSDIPGTMTQRWSQANQQLSNQFYVVLKVFSGYSLDPYQPDSWHQYAPANRSGTHAPYSSYVSPGFWLDDGSAPRLVRDSAAFESAVINMVNANVTWKLIETWNEWGEGSSVEPGNQVRLNTSTNKEEIDPTAPNFGNTYINILNQRLPNLEAGTGTNTTPSPSLSPTTSPTPTPIPGDANEDGKVDGTDYVIWLNHYYQSVTQGPSVGDFDRSSLVDGIDYILWLTNYNVIGPTPTPTLGPTVAP